VSNRAYTIVVGVDGTKSSADLLQWASDLARRLDGKIIAVHAWQPPDLANLVPFRVERDLVNTAEQRLADLVSENAKDVPTESHVVQGSPSRALLQAAADADLLVVGLASGRGSRPPGLLGSRLAMSARCPLVVVPTSTST
jgi:nucleotide-binding universal stress UspA family protein